MYYWGGCAFLSPFLRASACSMLSVRNLKPCEIMLFFSPPQIDFTKHHLCCRVALKTLIDLCMVGVFPGPWVFGCWGSSLNVFSLCLCVLNCNCRSRRRAGGWHGCVWGLIAGRRRSKNQPVDFPASHWSPVSEAKLSFPLILIMSPVTSDSTLQHTWRRTRAWLVFGNTFSS